MTKHLFISAHVDDEIIGAGPIISRAYSAGKSENITVVNIFNIDWNTKMIQQVYKKYFPLINLVTLNNQPTMWVDPNEIIKVCDKYVTRDTIVITHPPYSMHQDHLVAYEVGKTLSRYAGGLCYYYEHWLPTFKTIGGIVNWEVFPADIQKTEKILTHYKKYLDYNISGDREIPKSAPKYTFVSALHGNLSCTYSWDDGIRYVRLHNEFIRVAVK